MSGAPTETPTATPQHSGSLRALLRMPVAPGERMSIGWALAFRAQFAAWFLGFNAFFHGTAKWKPWWVFVRVALFYVGMVVACALLTAAWQRRRERRTQPQHTEP